MVVVSWCLLRAAPVVALHLVSGAGRGFSTWNHSSLQDRSARCCGRYPSSSPHPGDELPLRCGEYRCVSGVHAHPRPLGGLVARDRPVFGVRPAVRFTVAVTLTAAWTASSVWLSSPWRSDLADALGP